MIAPMSATTMLSRLNPLIRFWPRSTPESQPPTKPPITPRIRSRMRPVLVFMIRCARNPAINPTTALAQNPMVLSPSCFPCLARGEGPMARHRRLSVPPHQFSTNRAPIQFPPEPAFPPHRATWRASIVSRRLGGCRRRAERRAGRERRGREDRLGRGLRWGRAARLADRFARRAFQLRGAYVDGDIWPVLFVPAGAHQRDHPRGLGAVRRVARAESRQHGEVDLVIVHGAQAQRQALNGRGRVLVVAGVQAAALARILAAAAVDG